MENLQTDILCYFSPGCNRVDGNPFSFGESGKCRVSKQNTVLKSSFPFLILFLLCIKLPEITSPLSVCKNRHQKE